MAPARSAARPMCGYDRLVSYSCKRRGFRPSRLGRRMNDGAAFLVDHVIRDTPTTSPYYPPGLSAGGRDSDTPGPEPATSVEVSSRGRGSRRGARMDPGGVIHMD